MKLDEFLAEFEGVPPDEALEMLVEFGEQLPPLSAGRQAAPFPAECRVQECQSPVYLWVDVRPDGIRLEAEVSEKSPTVRGYVAMLVLGLTGARPAEIAKVPDDLLPPLGLDATLGMTRRRGFHGVLARIKREVARQTGKMVAPPAE